MSNIPAHVFREYDIRGMVDREITPQFAYLLGRGYGEVARAQGVQRVAVGHDCRLSSPTLAMELARGINDAGIDCLMIGEGPTPQLYFTVFAHELDGGIQVTGSHNPPDMNGFKLLIGRDTLSGNKIQELKQQVQRMVDAPPSVTPGKTAALDVREEYIAHIVERCRTHMGNVPVKVVVDAGNGVGGLVGPEVLRRLGAQVIELFCEPDGNFPNHHPDPTVMENIETLRKRVRLEKADCGIGWDGDADRIGVVDENGEVIFGDMLLALYARDVLNEQPGATVIGDVKCSSLLFDDVQRRGGNPVMWKTGHSLIKAKLKETKGAIAGEMSGHMFFAHRYFGFDDALYASARLLEVLSKRTQPLSQMLADLPKTYSTPEIRLDCPEEVKFELIARAQKAFPEHEVNTIDGVRVTFPHGWGLARASNTQPVIVLRFEADSPEHLSTYQELVLQRIETIKQELER